MLDHVTKRPAAGGPNATEEASAARESSFSIRALVPGEDATAFRLLNEEWIARHFTLEPRDVETLGDPDGAILAKGGHVYLAYAAGEAVGTVALVPMDGGELELSKMAVAPHLRGQGLGRRLLRHAISEARRLGAASLFLGSSTKLPAAVHLYESVGFEHLPPEARPRLPYARADVFMRLYL